MFPCSAISFTIKVLPYFSCSVFSIAISSVALFTCSAFSGSIKKVVIMVHAFSFPLQLKLLHKCPCSVFSIEIKTVTILSAHSHFFCNQKNQEWLQCCSFIAFPLQSKALPFVLAVHFPFQSKRLFFWPCSFISIAGYFRCYSINLPKKCNLWPYSFIATAIKRVALLTVLCIFHGKVMQFCSYSAIAIAIKSATPLSMQSISFANNNGCPIVRSVRFLGKNKWLSCFLCSGFFIAIKTICHVLRAETSTVFPFFTLLSAQCTFL